MELKPRDNSFLSLATSSSLMSSETRSVKDAPSSIIDLVAFANSSAAVFCFSIVTVLINCDLTFSNGFVPAGMIESNTAITKKLSFSKRSETEPISV